MSNDSSPASKRSKEDLSSLIILPPSAPVNAIFSPLIAGNSQQNQQITSHLTLNPTINSPSSANMAKLKVPTPLLTNDNTPTPVRTLLRDFEASGLLQVN